MIATNQVAFKGFLISLFLLCNGGVSPIIEAQCPSEGYDYATGALRSVIFDMSTGNDTAFLAEDVQVRLPYNIDNVQPSTRTQIHTDTKSFSNIVKLSESYSVDSQTQWSSSGGYADILQGLAGERCLQKGFHSSWHW